MRLSDAIRLGAMLKPQGFGTIEKDGHTCALGAIADAIGAVVRDDMSPFDNPITKRWPWVAQSCNDVCPLCERSLKFRGSVITHLNDSHKWTREQVADFVATIEPVEQDGETLQPDVALESKS